MKCHLVACLALIIVGCGFSLSSADAAEPTRILFLTQSKGFRHSAVKRTGASLAPAERAMKALAEKSKSFTVDCTQDAAKDFTRSNLANYDVVMFYTTGDLPIAKDDLEYFFKTWLTQKGHGFIGVHSAADTFHNYKPYWDMIGGTFNGHPWNANTKVTITVHDRTHPVARPWGDEFEITDEIYQFKNWQPDKVRVLMSLNMRKTALKKPYHVPIAWVKEYGQGKAMHMSLGHREDVWTNPTYMESLLGGVQWIVGMEQGNASPNPELSARQEVMAKAAASSAPQKPQTKRKKNQRQNQNRIVGKWKLKFTTPDEDTHEPSLTVARKAGKLNLSMTSDDKKLEPQEVTLQRGELKFRVDTKHDDVTVEVWFTAKVVRGKIEGSVSWKIGDETGETELTGTRVQEPKPKPTQQPENKFVSKATDPKTFRMLDGFNAELLYSVPQKEQGSWVSMTTDGQGRFIVCDQYGSLYRVTPPPIGSDADIEVEPLKVDIGDAHGLLWAFDRLYVMVNGDAAKGSGLYQVTDSDDDGELDEVIQLVAMNGKGEHGPHAIVLSPDKKSLYICAGNHTDLPEVEKSRVPQNWNEDQLLPRMWDAGGHAVGKMAPGGWVCKVDPDGANLELISIGYRNEFDIAFNTLGDLFTYDADMEWDIGAPWYRPTRINHVTSGSEFGWRSGTGKWPEYYPDSLPAVVDVGPGSPTGIVFGTGAKFPHKYQRALFISDWSYGILYAVHMEADGSGYTGSVEQFTSAAPLPLTDLVVNPADGALYVTTGGRRTQSGFYRITYTGSESTTPAPPIQLNESDSALRRVREDLESLHTVGNATAVEKAWPFLSHPDRSIRYAARIAVELQPIETWQTKALAERNQTSSIQAVLALARNGQSELLPSILESLARIDWKDLDESGRLEYLRAYSLSFARLGQPSDDVRSKIGSRFANLFPSDNRKIDRELCQLLVFLEQPSVVDAALDKMIAGDTQEEQMQYALSLRVAKVGWTPESRSRYFKWFNQAASHRGGHSFSGFLKNIRNEVIEGLSKEQLVEILTAKVKAPAVEEQLKARKFVKKWAIDDLVSAVESGSNGRDLKRGRELFSAVACYRCHRFSGEGGIVGPDITGVGKRFDSRQILESLLEPSKVVSDQYQVTLFGLSNGTVVAGRVANLNGPTLKVMTDMLNPGRLTDIKRAEIEVIEPAKTSMMPDGLLDTLTKDDILDLIAYMRSGVRPTTE